MSPRFIRARPASSVKKTDELEAFLDSCRDEELTVKANNAFDELEHNYELGRRVRKRQVAAILQRALGNQQSVCDGAWT